MSRILFFMNPHGLMDRDLASGIEQSGHELMVETINLATTPEGHQAELISSERYVSLLESFKPEMVLSFNGLGVDNDGFCAGELVKRGIPYVSWYVDQPRLANFGARYLPGNTHIFCFDRYFVPMLKDWGFPHAHYLPLATNPERFQPLATVERENSVCFVGDSDYAKISYLARNLDSELGSLGAGIYDSLDQAIDLVMQSPGRHTQELVRAVLALASFKWESLNTVQQDMLEGFIEREAGLRLRLALLAALHEKFALTVYGDELFSKVFGSACRGKANYFDESIVQVYSRHPVHVNISKFQLITAVNQRPFDISACAGFVLTDERACLRELFEPDEIVSYAHEDELVELTGYYLENAEARDKLALKARQRVLSDHTYARRIASIVETVLG